MIISNRTTVCLPVREIIHSLTFVDYLVQADKPWYNRYYTVIFTVGNQTSVCTLHCALFTVYCFCLLCFFAVRHIQIIVCRVLSTVTIRIYHRSPMQKSHPKGKRIMPETRFTDFPALSVDPRAGLSDFSICIGDQCLIIFLTYDINICYLLSVISFILTVYVA